jgi:hypothetical protein
VRIKDGPNRTYFLRDIFDLWTICKPTIVVFVVHMCDMFDHDGRTHMPRMFTKEEKALGPFLLSKYLNGGYYEVI